MLNIDFHENLKRGVYFIEDSKQRRGVFLMLLIFLVLQFEFVHFLFCALKETWILILKKLL